MKKTIHPYTKLAGLKSDKQFYERYKTPDDFFADYPEAANGIELPGTSAFNTQNQIPIEVQQGFNAMKSDTNLVNDPIVQQQMKSNKGLLGVTPDTITPYRPETPAATPQNDPNFQVKFSNKLNPKGGFNINDGLSLGLAGVNGLLPYQQPINQNQPLYNNAIQSNKYSTGSGATFDDGGKINKNQDTAVVRERKPRNTFDKVINTLAYPLTSAKYLLHGQPIPDYIEMAPNKNPYDYAIAPVNPFFAYHALDDMTGGVARKYKEDVTPSTKANGGSLQGSDLQVEGNKFEYLSPDTLLLKGDKHTDGGQMISYNGTPVEAEGQETIHLDNQGNVIVGGNMKIPGTDTKYKNGFKRIAQLEQKNQKTQDKASYLLNNYSPDYKYSAPTFNTGTVLADAYEQKKIATSDLKQELTDMQNTQLQYMDMGMKPKDAQKAVSGKKIKPNINYGDDPNNPNGLPDEMSGTLPEYSFSAPKYIRPNDTIDRLPIDGPVPMTNNIQPLDISDNKLFPANPPGQQRVGYIDTPEINNPYKKSISDPIKGMRNKFNPLNYLGEVSTVLDKPEPVPSTQVRPIMESEYNVSLQSKKNSIISAYKPALNAASNNPAQQAAIAGQMAEQLAAVDSEELQYNQQNTGGIRARNLQELRSVRDTNTRLGEDQQNKRMQAKSITQDNRFRAIESIGDKELKRKYLNNQLGLEEQLTGWRFNPDNTKQQWQMLHPDETFPGIRLAQIQLDEEERKTKRKTTVDNRGKRQDSYETTTTSYLGGKIAERKSSGMTKAKGKLKYC